MKKSITIVCLFVLLFCFSACGKNDPAETPAKTQDPAPSSQTEPKTDSPADTKPTDTEYLNEHVRYIGMNASEVKETYGEGFELIQYKGLAGMRFDDKNVAFLVTSEDGFVADENPVADVLLYDGKILNDLSVNATLKEIKEHIENVPAPAQDEETEEWSVTVPIGKYHYTFFWSADPESSSADYVCVY